MRTIIEAWKSYEQECVPASDPDTVREFERSMFYAGAAGVVRIIMQARASGLTDAALTAVLAGLQEEITADSLGLNDAERAQAISMLKAHDNPDV